jgi:sec-independent protein translocase protein TatA
MQLHNVFLFINLGVPELSIIVVLVLILFGPGKLPGVMKALGDGVKHFKDAASGATPEESRPEVPKPEASRQVITQKADVQASVQPEQAPLEPALSVPSENKPG